MTIGFIVDGVVVAEAAALGAPSLPLISTAVIL
jgi:hypothetical protein